MYQKENFLYVHQACEINNLFSRLYSFTIHFYKQINLKQDLSIDHLIENISLFDYHSKSVSEILLDDSQSYSRSLDIKK